jgi:ankyrin repeat protein
MLASPSLSGSTSPGENQRMMVPPTSQDTIINTSNTVSGHFPSVILFRVLIVSISAINFLGWSRDSIDSKSRDSRTPLSFAMESGHQDVVQLLLETRRVDVKVKDKVG